MCDDEPNFLFLCCKSDQQICGRSRDCVRLKLIIVAKTAVQSSREDVAVTGISWKGGVR